MKKAYSLDAVYMLKLIEADNDVSFLCTGSAKIKNVYQGLVRKGFITGEGKITNPGKEILAYLETEEGAVFVKKKVTNTSFDVWWKAYPGTDTFKHKNKTFTGSRSLRTRKADCAIKFNNIISEGEYTPEELIKAMEFDVLQKKEASYKNSTNKLSYLQNSLTYLNQRSYEPFIELIKQGISADVKSNKAYDVDI